MYACYTGAGGGDAGREEATSQRADGDGFAGPRGRLPIQPALQVEGGGDQVPDGLGADPESGTDTGGSRALVERVLALPSVAFTERTKRLPDEPGLYFAISDESEILYIGMSRKSIRRRWKTWHTAVNHVNKHGLQDRVRIAFVLYRDTSRLKDDESAALREFRPVLNSSGVPGYLERDQRMAAEACEWIDCEEHWHHKWAPLKPPTKTRPCVCIVHKSCSERAGTAFAAARATLEMDPSPPSPDAGA